MTVKLYRNKAPNNKVNKSSSITLVDTITEAIFKEDGALDILNPKVLIKWGTDVSDFATINYLEIPKYNRFYFINNIYTVGGLVALECKVDVLMSHKHDILNSKQYIMRSESKRSPYLVDQKIPFRSDKRVHYNPFGNDAFLNNCPHVILETAGTGGTVV